MPLASSLVLLASLLFGLYALWIVAKKESKTAKKELQYWKQELRFRALQTLNAVQTQITHFHGD